MKTKEITTKEIYEFLEFSCNKVFKYKGIFVAQHNYFYTHGLTIEKFEDKIINILRSKNIEIKVVESGDNWNSWPKDSYFEVRFKIV